jgi:hypothetical protein
MRRLLIVSVTAVLPLCFAPASVGSWLATSTPTGDATAHATSLSPGSQPTATLSGVDVLVSWPPSTAGAPVSGYEVRSYNASSGTPRTVGANCAGVIVATTCIETGMTAGTWRYTVVPRLASWIGVESPRSTATFVPEAPA